MVDSNPIVSVIIPTYNRATLIEKTLQSIRTQTYQNWECIIIDDFSTDNTKEIVQKFIENDNRFKIISNQRKKGAQGARNTGIIDASGEWIAFNDSDDEWLPDKLSLQIEIIAKKSSNPLLVIYGNCIVSDHYKNTEEHWSLNSIQEDNPIKFFLNDSSILFQSMITSKKALQAIGLLDEDVPSYQEWDTAIRLSQICDFVHIREPLFVYHKHLGETISKDVRRDIEGMNYVRVKYREDFIKHYDKTTFEESLLQNIARAAILNYWDLGIQLLLSNASFIPQKKYRYWLKCFKNKTNPLIAEKPSQVRKLLSRFKRKIYG